jgi:hypothetical protein
MYQGCDGDAVDQDLESALARLLLIHHLVLKIKQG